MCNTNEVICLLNTPPLSLHFIHLPQLKWAREWDPFPIRVPTHSMKSESAIACPHELAQTDVDSELNDSEWNYTDFGKITLPGDFSLMLQLSMMFLWNDD